MKAGYRTLGWTGIGLLLLVPAVLVVAVCLPFMGILNRRELK